MAPVIVGILAFVLMLIILLLGVPVGAAMGVLGFAGLAYMISPSAAFLKMGGSAFDTMNSYSYAVVPLFMFMAQIISSTGVGKLLFDFFNKLVCRFKGGLAIASILACGVFAAISSSSVATAVTIGLIALPEMKRMNYDDSLSTGSIAAGGTLGVFIPPSGMLMLYGIMTGASITKLFLGGIVPGIVLMILYCLAVKVTCIRNPNAGPKGQKYSAKEIWISFTKCGEIIVLIILVLGGLFANFFTPTEAGAVGASGAIVITLLRKKLTWKGFWGALKGALRNSGMVYGILIGAFLLNSMMSMTTLPSKLAGLLLATNLPPYVIVILIVIVLLFLGCFLDSMAIMTLTLPVLYPIVTGIGYDTIWFGVLMTCCMEMAVITPPVGINVYVVKGIDDSIPIGKVFRGIIPFLIAQIILVAIMLIVPDMVTFLGKLLGV